MIEIVSGQDEQWRLAPADEVAVGVEEEVATIHVAAKTAPVLSGDGTMRRLSQLVGPAVEHLVERLAVVVETDRLQQHG